MPFTLVCNGRSGRGLRNGRNDVKGCGRARAATRGPSAEHRCEICGARDSNQSKSNNEGQSVEGNTVLNNKVKSKTTNNRIQYLEPTSFYISMLSMMKSSKSMMVSEGM